MVEAGPCWGVEKALQDAGVSYRVAPGASRLGKRDEMVEHTGQRFYPAIEFDDGTWYREESKDMEQTIRDGKLFERGISFYHAHAPLDMHPEVSPSRLVAMGLGLRQLEEYGPIADGIPGGACIVGESAASLDELAARLQEVLGEEIPVEVVTRPREEAGRVAVVAGGGAGADLLELSLARGCQTYVTGNAARQSEHPFFRRKFDEFRKLAAEHDVALVDGTHYGTEKPPQLAMVTWFQRLGLDADFRPDGPKLPH